MKISKSSEDLCLVAANLLKEHFHAKEDEKIDYDLFSFDDYLDGYLFGYISTFLNIKAKTHDVLYEELEVNFENCLFSIYSITFKNLDKINFVDRHFSNPPIQADQVTKYEFGCKRGIRASSAFYLDDNTLLEPLDLLDSSDGTLQGIHYNWFVLRVLDKYVFNRKSGIYN